LRDYWLIRPLLSPTLIIVLFEVFVKGPISRGIYSYKPPGNQFLLFLSSALTVLSEINASSQSDQLSI